MELFLSSANSLFLILTSWFFNKLRCTCFLQRLQDPEWILTVPSPLGNECRIWKMQICPLEASGRRCMESNRLVSLTGEYGGCFLGTVCKLLTGTKSGGPQEALVGLDNYSLACFCLNDPCRKYGQSMILYCVYALFYGNPFCEILNFGSQFFRENLFCNKNPHSSQRCLALSHLQTYTPVFLPRQMAFFPHRKLSILNGPPLASPPP